MEKRRGLGFAAVAGALAAVAIGCGQGAPSGDVVPAADPAAAGQSAQPPSPGPPDVPAQLAAMRRLEFMVGRWEGQGWFVNRQGRTDFTQTEEVAPRLGGLLLVVDGKGLRKDDPTRPVHDAFAIASFDQAAQAYRWEAFSDGNRLETRLEVGDRGWRWSFEPVPGVIVRYQAEFTPDRWRETGETSTDGGATWRPNLDMTLRRVG